MTTIPHPSDLERGWRLLVVFAGVAQIGMGVGLYLTGSAIFAAPIFALARVVPMSLWAALAVVGGVAILLHRLGLTGLVVAALWWGLWSAFLIIGVFKAHGPFSSVSPYLFITAVHVLLAFVEHRLRHRGTP